MIQFMAWQLGLVLVQLKHIEDGARNHVTFLGNRDRVIPTDYAKNLIGYLGYARRQFETIELGAAVLRLIDNFIRQLQFDVSAAASKASDSEQASSIPSFTYDQIVSSVHPLLEVVEAELRLRRFAYVPVERAKRLDKIDHDWADVQEKFPLSKVDIRDAIECYALDKHTACIFHLMRVSEHGLRRLARRLRVTLSDKGKKQPLEYADWDKVITAIKAKITEARQLSRGPKKEVRLQLWSEAADHCEYMKDNWRNAVSHTRKRYGPTDALSASDRVHGFMTFLADALK